MRIKQSICYPIFRPKDMSLDDLFRIGAEIGYDAVEFWNRENEDDYEAVIESRELLHSMFGGPWPREGFTLEENLRDLERHQQEFLDRKAFAYTVVSLDESRVLGCLYINPARKTDADAKVHMWVRQSEYDKGLDAVLFQEVRNWLDSAWPFATVAYPGRE